MGGQNIFLVLIVIAVAVIVAAWLIHFIVGIRKTQKVYQEIMQKKHESDMIINAEDPEEPESGQMGSEDKTES